MFISNNNKEVNIENNISKLFIQTTRVVSSDELPVQEANYLQPIPIPPHIKQFMYGDTVAEMVYVLTAIGAISSYNYEMEGHEGSRVTTNLYTLGIADASTGKTTVMRGASEICKVDDQINVLGEVTSGRAVIDGLMRTKKTSSVNEKGKEIMKTEKYFVPAILRPGEFKGTMAHMESPEHGSAMKSFLLEAFTDFTAKYCSLAEINRTGTSQITIDKPRLSLMSTTQTGNLQKFLFGGNFVDGLLQRFIFVEIEKVDYVPIRESSQKRIDFDSKVKELLSRQSYTSGSIVTIMDDSAVDYYDSLAKKNWESDKARKTDLAIRLAICSMICRGDGIINVDDLKLSEGIVERSEWFKERLLASLPTERKSAFSADNNLITTKIEMKLRIEKKIERRKLLMNLHISSEELDKRLQPLFDAGVAEEVIEKVTIGNSAQNDKKWILLIGE